MWVGAGGGERVAGGKCTGDLYGVVAYTRGCLKDWESVVGHPCERLESSGELVAVEGCDLLAVGQVEHGGEPESGDQVGEVVGVSGAGPVLDGKDLVGPELQRVEQRSKRRRHRWQGDVVPTQFYLHHRCRSPSGGAREPLDEKSLDGGNTGVVAHRVPRRYQRVLGAPGEFDEVVPLCSGEGVKVSGHPVDQPVGDKCTASG